MICSSARVLYGASTWRSPHYDSRTRRRARWPPQAAGSRLAPGTTTPRPVHPGCPSRVPALRPGTRVRRTLAFSSASTAALSVCVSAGSEATEVSIATPAQEAMGVFQPMQATVVSRAMPARKAMAVSQATLAWRATAAPEAMAAFPETAAHRSACQVHRRPAPAATGAPGRRRATMTERPGVSVPAAPAP